ncbi:MAG: tetratricopeptide repeat protein [Rhodocyclaceae bacterium]|nr:tetratricopeptide repeat protein [Rhodocyclaceae bacterium]
MTSMTPTLWIFMGSALVLMLGAAAFILLPLRPLISRRWFFGGMALAPAVTLGLYLLLGAPSIIDANSMLEARSQHDTGAMLSALEGKLATKPEDAEGWYVLGRSYLALDRNKDAEEALGKAVKLAPKEARMLSQYAEAIALNSGKLEGRPMELVNAALELDDKEEKALELAGLNAYQRQEWAQSIYFWRRLLKQLPKESEFYEDIARAVKEAEVKSADASGLGERAKLLPPTKKAKGANHP